MMGFQYVFVAALSALVFACVIAKFVSVAFYGGYENDSKVKVDVNKVVKVVEKVNLGNALKVRESRSKKRVKFADDVVVRHIDQLGFEEGGNEIGNEIKRVVFCGEEGVVGEGLGFVEGRIVEGKNGKDEIFKCFDEQKRTEVEKNLVCSDDWDKGMPDEAFEIETIGKRSDIQHLSLEKVNVINEGNSEKVEGDCSASLYDPLSIKEETLIKEETSTSGRIVLESLMVDKNMNNVVFSSQSYVDFVIEHAALDQKEDTLIERLDENMEGGLSGRDVEEEPVEEQCENVEGGLSKEDEQRAMKNQNVVIDEDDWEGIERTELDKVFGEAVNYVEIRLQGKDDQLAKLGSHVQMQLYGLHKIAVEGPCHQAQPMALNFFARAKWNAWQKLGSVSPEVAMEEYIKLLTEHFPEWLQHFYDGDGGKSSLASGISHDADHSCSLQDTKPNLLPEPTKIED